jgi:lipoprotein NlpI
MNAMKIVKVLSAVMCLIFIVLIVNCYGAKKTAEQFYAEGKKYSSVENADKAINSYSQAIKLNPKFAKAYNNRGIAYVGKSQYDLAIADFNKAIELDQKNGKVYNNRAVAYWYKGEKDKAAQDVQKAKSLGIKINPEFIKLIQAPPPATQ